MSSVEQPPGGPCAQEICGRFAPLSLLASLARLAAVVAAALVLSRAAGEEGVSLDLLAFLVQVVT